MLEEGRRTKRRFMHALREDIRVVGVTEDTEETARWTRVIHRGYPKDDKEYTSVRVMISSRKGKLLLAHLIKDEVLISGGFQVRCNVHDDQGHDDRQRRVHKSQTEQHGIRCCAFFSAF